MPELLSALAALDAFLQEHRRCGERCGEEAASDHAKEGSSLHHSIT